MVDKIGLRFDASSGRRPSTQYLTVINGETGIQFRISFLKGRAGNQTQVFYIV